MQGEPWYVEMAITIAAFVGYLWLVLSTRANHSTLAQKVSAIASQTETTNQVQQNAMADQAKAFSQAVDAVTKSFQLSMAFRDDQDKFQRVVVTSLQDKYTQLEQQNARLEGQYRDVCDGLAERDRQTESLRAMLDEKIDELTQARTDLAQARADYAQAQQTIAAQDAKLKRLELLEARVQDLEGQVAELTTKLTAYERLVAEKDEALKAKDAIINGLTGELAKRDQELLEARAELARVRATLPENRDTPAPTADDAKAGA